MDALTPPSRRPIPDDRSTAMRNMLITQVTRKRSGWVRWLAPWLTAVAVPAIATTGFLVVPSGHQQSAPPPAGTTTKVTASPTGGPRPSPSISPSISSSISPSSTTSPSGLPNQQAAYNACIDRIAFEAEFRAGIAEKGLVGKVARHTAEGWTVVVANKLRAYACQVQPDSAASSPRTLPAPRLARVTVDDVAIADNARSNREPGQEGDMAWGGGPLPRGVNAIRYTFPDGHVETAVVANGYWVMHYFSPQPFDWQGPKIKARLSGPAGTRTFELTWGDDTCNQTSHGC